MRTRVQSPGSSGCFLAHTSPSPPDIKNSGSPTIPLQTAIPAAPPLAYTWGCRVQRIDKPGLEPTVPRIKLFGMCPTNDHVPCSWYRLRDGPQESILLFHYPQYYKMAVVKST